MNSERLCPLCCENKTIGTICRDCSLKQSGFWYGEAGAQWTIRGVPASQARCEQVADKREQVYVFQHTEVQSVHFFCRTCGKPLELARPELGATSNTFCPACDRQYWVDWQAGVLHMGLDDDQLYSRMMDRFTYRGRVGKRIS